MNILIVGYPYVRERYFATFRRWPERGGALFLLPSVWTAKGGTVVFHPPKDANVLTTSAYFSHSHYAVIGGLLKGFMPAFPLYLWRNRRRVDLVYSCSEPTLLTTLYQALCSKLLGKKHVCFTWENIPYEKKLTGPSYFVHRILLWMNLALSDGLVCGNTAGADIHKRLTKKPIAVIPMSGVDPEQFKPDHEARLHSQFAPNIVYTFIGAIGHRKGLQVLVHALPKVLAEVSDALVIIAGSGEAEGELDELIGKFGLQKHIIRFPWMQDDEIVRLLSVSDIFVYPSIPYKGWAEQFGYSMAEASLMELPVISTRSGSIADVVLDGKTGLLVPPDDSDQLASAMVRLGRDNGLRMSLGNAGRNYMKEHFSHERVVRSFYEFFEQVFMPAHS